MEGGFMNPILEAQLMLRRIPVVRGLGFASAGIAILTILISYGVIRPLREHANAQLITLALAASVAQNAPVDSTELARLKEFRAMLSERGAGDEKIRVMFAAAGSEQLAVTQAEYRTDADQGGQFRRVTVSFPVSGTYPQIRSFIISLLSENPSVALSDVTFKREREGGDLIAANLRFSIFQRPLP
jgi:branched-subunit amino acid ABC-type transport system permease component